MKSSSCRPTSKFWTFWGSRDKCWAVNLWAGKTCSTLILGSENTETLHLSRNIVSWQVWSTCHAKIFFCGSKKVVAKSRARVYFEQQILALLLVLHQTHNLSCLADQPISAPHFFNPQQMFLLRVKLIKQGEKRETSTKTCNETMLRDKLRVFVSRISAP